MKTQKVEKKGNYMFKDINLFVNFIKVKEAKKKTEFDIDNIKTEIVILNTIASGSKITNSFSNANIKDYTLRSTIKREELWEQLKETENNLVTILETYNNLHKKISDIRDERTGKNKTIVDVFYYQYVENRHYSLYEISCLLNNSEDYIRHINSELTTQLNTELQKSTKKAHLEHKKSIASS